MPEPTTARVAIVLGTLMFAWVEWLFFELLRLPYLPPYDMNTLLGTEMLVVPCVMGRIALAWLALTTNLFQKVAPTRRDYIAFGALLVLLSTVFCLVVAYPLWPVTPTELLRGYWLGAARNA